MNPLQADSRPALIEKRRNGWIPHRWYHVLILHLTGRTAEEIAQETGLSKGVVYKILNHPDTIIVRQQLFKTYEQEFEALFGKVVSTIKQALNSEDERVRLEATNQWLKAHGKFQPKKVIDTISAEDIVINILNQG